MGDEDYFKQMERRLLIMYMQKTKPMKILEEMEKNPNIEIQVWNSSWLANYLKLGFTNVEIVTDLKDVKNDAIVIINEEYTPNLGLSNKSIERLQLESLFLCQRHYGYKILIVTPVYHARFQDYVISKNQLAELLVSVNYYLKIKKERNSIKACKVDILHFK